MAQPFEELIGMSRSKLSTSNNVVLYGWQVKNIVHTIYLKYFFIICLKHPLKSMKLLLQLSHSTKSIIDLFDEGKEAIDEESKNESLTHFEVSDRLMQYNSDELGHEIQVFFNCLVQIMVPKCHFFVFTKSAFDIKASFLQTEVENIV
ncbi:hypothetical protein ACJX0J_038680 [Zea mays]